MPITVPPAGLYVSAGFLLEDLTADIDGAAWHGYLTIGLAAALSLLLALLSQVRGTWPELPVLLVTCYADVSALTEDVLPADQIVRKPFRGAALLARIELIWGESFEPG